MVIERKLTKDAYLFYARTEKDNGYKPRSSATYRSVVNGFNRFIMDKVFDGYDVHLSNDFSLGVVGVRGIKEEPKIDEHGNIVGLAPDWQKTNKLWNENPEAKAKGTIIFCTNEHSNGIRYGICWMRGKMKVLFGNVYSLKFCRGNRRAGSAHFKNGREYLLTFKK